MGRKGKGEGEGVLIITHWMGSEASLSQTKDASSHPKINRLLDYFGRAIMGMPPTPSGVAFKSYHTISIKQPIDISKGRKDQEGNPIKRSQNFDPDIKRDTRKAPKGIPTLSAMPPWIKNVTYLSRMVRLILNLMLFFA